MAHAASLSSPGLAFAGDKAIIAARPVLEKLALFGTDFSADAVQPGTTLKVPVFAGTAQTFAPASSHGYNDSEGTVNWVPLTFSTHKKLTFGFTDKNKLDVDTDPFWAKCGIAAGQGVAKALVQAVTGVLVGHDGTAVTPGCTQVTSWTTSLANLASLRDKCATLGVDPANCVVMLLPSHYATLLSLLPSNVIGDGKVVTSGVIPGLYGFKAVIEAPNISKASGASSAVKGVGFVVPENALLIGGRVIRPQEGVCEEWGTTSDEITGLTLGHRITVDQNYGERFYTVEAVIGATLAYGTASAPTGAPGFLQLVTA